MRTSTKEIHHLGLQRRTAAMPFTVVGASRTGIPEKNKDSICLSKCPHKRPFPIHGNAACTHEEQTTEMAPFLTVNRHRHRGNRPAGWDIANCMQLHDISSERAISQFFSLE